MNQQFSIIDIFCGIGGMSKGFLDAGYQVNEAIDYDIEKVKIYENIFGKNIAKCQDVCLLNPEEIKDADIITGGILLSGFHIMEQKRGAEYDSVNKWMVGLVCEKRPKAIVLETARINGIRNVCDCYVNMGYHICYEMLAAQNYSGLPFHEIRTYIVGIREDLYNREFYFPAVRYNKYEMDENGYLFEKNVDPWYRQIRRIADFRFEEKKIYVRQMNKFYDSNLFMNGSSYENFICDDKGLRRCTHIEMARLKGLELYEYNKCKNKRLMYHYIAQATDAIVISYIAKALREYLGGKETNDNATICLPKENILVKRDMKLLVAGTHDEKVDEKDNIDTACRKIPSECCTAEKMEDNIDAGCPRNEWDALIEAVDAEINNNIEHGKSLEKLMLKFFSEVEGFQCQPNARTETEEIDIWILNGARDGLFAKESNLILCECKNWNQHVGRKELNLFLEKMKNRNKRCKLGFFIAWNGVTSNFDRELLRITHDEEVVVLLVREGIINAIKTGSIMKYLQDEYSKALLR